MKNILADNEHVKPLGRTYFDDSILWAALSGCGISFETNTTTLSITFIGDTSATCRQAGFTPDPPENSYAHIGIFIDGVKTTSFLLNEAIMTISILPSAAEKQASYLIDETDDSVIKTSHKHTIEIIKLSESAMSMFGIGAISVDDDAFCKPTPKYRRSIEFIGDSITCGFGVREPNLNAVFSTETEDCTRAYAYEVAKMLDADYSLVCFSGFGIYSGWTPDKDIQNTTGLVPLYYDKLGFSYGKFPTTLTSAADIKWDFSKFTPNIVVINLGTNDTSYCELVPEREEAFTVAYEEFLGTVRKCNPDAYIVCILGSMGSYLFSKIEEAVSSFSKKTGDKRVSSLWLPEQDRKDGIVIYGHPSIRTHEKLAVFLSERLSGFFNKLSH